MPEGGPSSGGPLSLLPLSGNQPESLGANAGGGINRMGQQQYCTAPPTQPLNLSQKQLQKRATAAAAAAAAEAAAQGVGGDSSDNLDMNNDSTSSESVPSSMPSLMPSYPSCNTLSAQMQMTHVRSETQLSKLADQKQHQHHYQNQHQHQQQQQCSSMVPVHLGARGARGGATGAAQQGSTAAAVEAFRQSCAIPTYNTLHGNQQG